LSDDDGYALSYQALKAGTPVWTADGTQLGTVAAVLENKREQMFDGLVVTTPAGRRFVDAPEVARIAERRVTLTIDAAQAATLPARDGARGIDHGADVRGRLGRLWRRRREP
jgi:hypothetical protein